MFKSLLFLWKYAWKVDKYYLLCLILNQITSAITPISIMIFPKVLLDELMGQNRITTLILIVCSFSMIIFLSQMCSSLLSNTAFYKRCIVLERFQVDLNEHLANADYENLEDPEFLNLKQNAEKFLYANGQGFSFVLDRAMNIIGKIIIFITIIGVIATLNIFVLFVFLGLSALNSYVQMQYKKTYANLEIQKNPKERELAYFSNLFSDIKFGKEIRINGDKELFIDYLKSCLHSLWIFYKKQMHLLNRSKFSLYFVDLLQRGISYIYMIYMVSIGSITIANFTMYVNAIATFTDSMNNVIDSINDIRQFSIYFASVEKYLNLPSKIVTGNENYKMPEKIEKIEFQNVSFKYNGTDRWALKNINCVFNGNEKVSIVGENGAGKSTFIKLICRLYEPSEGCILLNGVDIRKYQYSEYVKKISAIFQDFQLFSIRLDENISLSEKIDENEMYSILEHLGLLEKIKNLPKSIKSRIHKDFDEEGFEPSGGIAQKIAISRAIYKDAPIIILDEPTAALDPRAEFEIYERFNELTNHKLAFYISHRLSSSRFCDKILVFKEGQLIEHGTHEELINAQSVYYELYNMQSRYYIDDSAEKGGKK